MALSSVRLPPGLEKPKATAAPVSESAPVQSMRSSALVPLSDNDSITAPDPVLINIEELKAPPLLTAVIDMIMIVSATLPRSAIRRLLLKDQSLRTLESAACEVKLM